MGDSLLSFQNVSLKTQDNYLVENISFSVQPNEIITVIGPNGAGKSTLAKLVLGIIEPSAGRIYRDPLLKFAYVPQKFTIDKALPIKVKRLMRINRSLNSNEIKKHLARMGVEHLYDNFLQTLSGGEMQKVLLARAAAQKANFLVLDEPLQGVEFASEVKIYEHIAQLKDLLGCAILLISHDLNIVMFSTDRVMCLDKHICCMGTPKEVMATKHYANLLGDRDHIIYDHKHSLYN